MRDFAGRADAALDVVIVLEEKRVSHDRRRLAAGGVHIRDPRRPSAQRGHAHRLEQAVDERLAEGRLLVRKPPEFRRQLLSLVLAAMSADPQPLHAGEDRLVLRRLLLPERQFQLREWALAFTPARVASYRQFHSADDDVRPAPGISVAEFSSSREVVLVLRLFEDLPQRGFQREIQRCLGGKQRRVARGQTGKRENREHLPHIHARR